LISPINHVHLAKVAILMRYAPLAEAAHPITKEIGEVLREKTADVVVEGLGVWHAVAW